MQLANPIPTVNAPPQTDLISFLCPCCSHRLIVSAQLSGVIGPCPVCAKTIRAPFGATLGEQTVEPNQVVTTSQTVSPVPYEQDPVPEEVIEPVRQEAFSPSFCIETPKQEELDDSWRERYHREREQTKKRHKRDRMIWNLFYSKGARRFQRAGVFVLTGILIATVVVLFLNRRSGGALLNRVFGN